MVLATQTDVAVCQARCEAPAPAQLPQRLDAIHGELPPVERGVRGREQLGRATELARTGEERFDLRRAATPVARVRADDGQVDACRLVHRSRVFSPARAEPPPASPRPQSVLLARRRGDRASAHRALRGARRRVRRDGDHRPAARPRARPGLREPRRRRDRARALGGVRALAAASPRDQLPDLSGSRAAPRPLRRRAAGRRALHDRPADGRRRRARGRAALPRAARRRQPGRLPRDRGRAEAPHESGPRRDPARADELLPPPRRPGGRDRGDDAAAPARRRACRRSGCA